MATAAAVHHLVIGNWLPARLNQLMRGASKGGRIAAAKLKRTDRDLVAWARLQTGTPKATGRRRVSLELTLGPRMRGGDPDAYWKSTLDALVAAGLLVDDSRKWCELGTVRFGSGDEPSTRIILEDINP